MSNPNESNIDSLLADYSDQVAEYGLNSTQEQQFFNKHRSDSDFVELAGVLRHLRESPPRIQSTDVSVVPAPSRVWLKPFGFVSRLVFLALIVSTTWLGVDRAMNKPGLGLQKIASMDALGGSVQIAPTDDTVTEVATNDRRLEIGSEFDRKTDWQELMAQELALAHPVIAARSRGDGAAEYRERVMPELAETAMLSVSGPPLGFMRVSERYPRERMARLLVDTFVGDAITANLLAEAFLGDATALRPIDLPKLNLAYAFARLAVALDTSAPDAGSDEAVQPTGGRILNTYGHVLDTIAEAMEDQAEEGFILTLDRSSGEAWQRVIAAFEARLEDPLIDEESKAAARRRIETLEIAGTERNPAEDGN